MPLTGCRYFTGYKPCSRSQDCSEACAQKDVPHHSLLIVHLGALGAVVRSTSLLAAIKRKYPSSRITWVTQAPADQLLLHNPLIDRVLTTHHDQILQLQALHFDVAFVIDKSLQASGVANMVMADKVFGFQVDAKTGSILPATSAADELWQLGLSDNKKFYENQKAETQLLIEALELQPFCRDEYYLPLSDQEIKESLQRQARFRLNSEQPVIGFNTGCSSVIPYKKWTVDFHRQVISSFLRKGFSNIVLLGGKEDDQRNQEIAKDLPVIQSPTQRGLRDGLISVEACDIILSGDSLGMHMAIARKKFVVAWFGPSCAQEIDLYGRGEKILSEASCSPCWKRHCNKQVMCYDQMDFVKIQSALQAGVHWWQQHNPTLSYKRPSLEISF